MDRGTRGVSQAGRTRDSRCYSVPAISGTPPPPPPEGTGNMLEAGGDQIDLEFALKPPLSSSKAKTQETINSLFKCPNRRNNSPRWCLSDHWTPENVAELVIYGIISHTHTATVCRWETHLTNLFN